jgi:hypothetical protein
MTGRQPAAGPPTLARLPHPPYWLPAAQSPTVTTGGQSPHTRSAALRGKRDLDDALRGHADLADLRTFRLGAMAICRPGHDRAGWEVPWLPSWRLFMACRLQSALRGSGRWRSLVLLVITAGERTRTNQR